MKRPCTSILTIFQLLDANVISTAFCVKATTTITSRPATTSSHMRIYITTASSYFDNDNENTNNGASSDRVLHTCYYPNKIEDWDSHHVESWMKSLGYEKYVSGFAADYKGIGVDGNRLVYLGTPDQLDHIEYMLDLLGVDNDDDQVALGNAIIALVGDDQFVENLSRQSRARANDGGPFAGEEKDDTNYQI